MAKLTPKDPQFGIPIATRIRGELAIHFNNEAAKENKTLSRYVAEFIERAAANQKSLNELQILFAKAKQTAAIKEKWIKDLEAQLLKEKETTPVKEKRVKELEAQTAKQKETITTTEKRIGELETQLAKEKETTTIKEKRVKELEIELVKEKDVARKVAGRLILKITEGNNEKTKQLAEAYNTILKNERQNNA